jgi:hypothetical protein
LVEIGPIMTIQRGRRLGISRDTGIRLTSSEWKVLLINENRLFLKNRGVDAYPRERWILLNQD